MLSHHTGDELTPPPDAGQAARAERADRAFALYCQGMRPAAIAAELGVSATSVRRWLRATLRTLADETQDETQDETTDEDTPGRQTQVAQIAHLVRAIESQRAIAHAAWEAYERERAVEDAILRGELDRVRRRALRPAIHDDDAPATHHRQGAISARRTPRAARPTRGVVSATAGDAPDAGEGDCSGDPMAFEAGEAAGNIVIEEYERPRHTSQGARYLAVALAAQREVARLQGLYERIERALPGVHIILSRRPDGPENTPPAPGG